MAHSTPNSSAPDYLSDKDYIDHRLSFRDGIFDNQVVIVTGSGSGLGKAIAWFYARLGAKLILIGRTQEKLDATQAALQSAGFEATALATDIRDPEAIAHLFDRIHADHGRLDILVNNAGGQFPQPAIDFSINGWNSVINNNLNGTWYMMQRAAQYWRDHKQTGNIVNIVTVVDRGMLGAAHTCAARAGVIHLSKTVAVEWAEHNIRVNCIAPGIIATEGMEVYPDEARARFSQSNPMKRFGSAWDVAEACGYLSGASGNFITGETLTIDGGGKLWGELWLHSKPDYFQPDT